MSTEKAGPAWWDGESRRVLQLLAKIPKKVEDGRERDTEGRRR